MSRLPIACKDRRTLYAILGLLWAIGFVASLIGAWLYNALVGMVGGIQLDVQ